MDFNYFNGTEEQFKMYLDADYVPPVEPPPSEPNDRSGLVVARDGVRVREYPSKASKPLGNAVRKGGRPLIDKIEGLWVHVTEVDGRAREGWMCTFDNGMKLVEVFDAVP